MNRALFIVLLLLGGCSPENQPPKGYVEACYGGDWNEKLVGKTPVYSAVIDVQKDQWSKLKVVLKKLATDNNLDYFDSSEESKSLSMLYVSACSKRGLWVHFDQRVWSFEGSEPHSPLPLMASVYIYDNEEIWEGIPEALDGLLKSNWPGSVNTKHSYESSLRNSVL